MARQRIIVIGGGPAGLMAAGQAALRGFETILLEKKDRVGRKLSITGKGRCNLTNIAPLEDFIEHFGKKGKFLRQAFNRFFSHDLAVFLGELGVEIITERGGRVFPAGENAPAVTEALKQWVEKLGVSIRTKSPVKRLLIDDNRITGVMIGGNRIEVGAVIIATGGASYPATGSTGDGFRLAKSVGHKIIPIRPALVPLVTKGDTAPRLQGLSLRNVAVKLLIDGKKRRQAFGEMLFTHYGLSGPIILTLSGDVVDALQEKKDVTISIDLKAALDEKKLEARLLRDLQVQSNRQFNTLLKGLLPAKLIPVCCDLVEIAPDKIANQISAVERRRLRLWLKDFRFEISGHRSFDEAIVTAGGVDIREVDPRTMQSRLISGLYFAGEILDVNGDTGGYNLQAAFSTGWLAGRGVGKAGSKSI